MNAIRVLLALSCALVLAGCGATTNAGKAEGFSKLTPDPATRTYIVKADPVFAGQVAAHNGYGRSQGLWE